MTDSSSDLTDRQRECLALVFVGRESKTIAPLLKLAPGTVDQYLKGAMKRYGASSRREAATSYARAYPDELRRILQRLDVTAIPLADQQLGLANRAVATGGTALSRKLFGLPIPTRERRWNELPGWQRIVWSVVIAVTSVAIVSLLIGLSRHSLAGLATPH